ncbi:hypothetical protein [Paraburkholderia aromaticivorans]|uniref:hypothetical protein n=1 Tax=Paraburkholderia aromaticivorans TaxID=2026199 RepID=UPI001455DEDD
MNCLTEWRHSAGTPWLKDAPVHPQRQALKDLDRAFVNFFEKRTAFPRFRRKGMSESFRYPDAKQIRLDRENGRIFLPKLGYVRYHNSRTVLGKVHSAAISLRAGKWFVSILTKRYSPESVCLPVDVDSFRPKASQITPFRSSTSLRSIY